MATTALARRGSGTISGYRAALRDVFGGIGTRARSLGSNIQRVSSAGLTQYRAASGLDGEPSLGRLFARQVAPGVATAAAGVLDNTQVGAWFSGLTGGMVNASTALAGLGIVLRGFDIDRNYLGRTISGANGALIRGLIPKWTYDLGSRVPGATRARIASLSGVPEVSGAPAPAAQEPIPGEATVS